MSSIPSGDKAPVRSQRTCHLISLYFHEISQTFHQLPFQQEKDEPSSLSNPSASRAHTTLSLDSMAAGDELSGKTA